MSATSWCDNCSGYPGADFGGGFLSPTGSYDAFVAKFTPDGAHQWSKLFGLTGITSGSAIAADAEGNVLLTGQLGGSADFGGGVLSNVGGVSDIYLAKLDSSANHLWSKRFGGPGWETALAVATDSMGNLLLTGFLNDGSADFGGGTLSSTDNSFDAFIAKLDPAGNHIWSKSFGEADTLEMGYSIAADLDDNVVVTASARTNPFDPSATEPTDGVLVAKLDSEGNPLWSKLFGDAVGYGASLDAWGNVFVTGALWGTTDFGGGELTATGTLQPDVFIAKFDPAGNHLWSRRFGDDSYQRGYAITTDAAGNVSVAGWLRGSADFGGGGVLTASPETTAAFVTTLDPIGAHLWSRQFGGAPTSSEASAHALTAAPNGQLFVTGSLSGTAPFDDVLLTSAGNADIFLLRVAP